MFYYEYFKKSCTVNWKRWTGANHTNLESGKKVARFSLATNEYYKDANGEKQTETNWHTVVAWGKTAEIIEKYVDKGKEIGVTGKLRTRTFTTDGGSQRYVTEVEAREILLLGTNNNNL